MTTVWRRHALVAVVASEEGARVALLHLDAIQPVVLEGSAAAVWALVDGVRNADGILAALELEFGPMSSKSHDQVHEFLGVLASQQLIEPVSKEISLEPPVKPYVESVGK